MKENDEWYTPAEIIRSLGDFDLVQRMTREVKVAAIPTSVFYHEKDDHKIIRFCFAKQDETLQKAAERLCRI